MNVEHVITTNTPNQITYLFIVIIVTCENWNLVTLCGEYQDNISEDIYISFLEL